MAIFASINTFENFSAISDLCGQRKRYVTESIL